MFSAKELSYAAGIIDGEGCISIVKRKKGIYSTYQDSIRVHMKHKDIPYWMHERFGGKLYKRNEPKIAYIWQLWGVKAREFLYMIEPFIVEKKKQIDLFLEMGRLKESSRSFQKDPPTIKQRKLHVYNRLRILHAT